MRGSGRPELPPAPWSPFPLVELCILISLVVIVVGFFADGSRRTSLLAAGAALGSLATLEFTVREHVSGYRSHSTLLAGIVAVGVGAVLFFATSVPQEVILGVGIVVFGLVFQALRSIFRRRSGGLSFR